MSSFKTKPKAKSDGSFWACKKCNKVPTAETDIYMENLGTKESPQWVACQDLECFKAQGGHEPSANSGFKKGKTPTELYEYRKELSEKCWAYAEQKAEQVVKIVPQDILGIDSVKYQEYLKHNITLRDQTRIMIYQGMMNT